MIISGGDFCAAGECIPVSGIEVDGKKADLLLILQGHLERILKLKISEQ